MIQKLTRKSVIIMRDVSLKHLPACALELHAPWVFLQAFSPTEMDSRLDHCTKRGYPAHKIFRVVSKTNQFCSWHLQDWKNKNQKLLSISSIRHSYWLRGKNLTSETGKIRIILLDTLMDYLVTPVVQSICGHHAS